MFDEKTDHTDPLTKKNGSDQDQETSHKEKKRLFGGKMDAKGIIYLIMVAFMVIAAGAFWMGQAMRMTKETFSMDQLAGIFYAIGFVVTLVFHFTKFFDKRKTIVALIVITLMFLLVLFY